MMRSVWPAVVALLTLGYSVSVDGNSKDVKTLFEFVLRQTDDGKINIIADEANFRRLIDADITKKFNASIDDINISPVSTWETVEVSYNLNTNLESSYSLAVRDNMRNVISIGEYVFAYINDSANFISVSGSLETKESWKETWYEIGHQIVYASLVALFAIAVFSIAVYFTCRWGKRRPPTEGRYVLNETPRASRAQPSGVNSYAQELTSDEDVGIHIDENNTEMNGHAQSNGDVLTNEEKIEMKAINGETPQKDSTEHPVTENKGFEKEENSMFAKLVYSEYSVPAKHSHDFL